MKSELISDNLIEKAKQVALLKNWDVDFLEKGSPIFQDYKKYTFSSDSTKLAKAVDVKGGETIVDLCSGSGIVGLEIAELTSVSKLIFVEIQTEVAEMNAESAKLSTSKAKMEVVCDSVQSYASKLSAPIADIVVCNPPYFKKGAGTVSANLSIAISRHELKLSLEELFIATKRILKRGGKFYLIHIAERRNEVEKLSKRCDFKLVNQFDLAGKLKRNIYVFKLL